MVKSTFGQLNVGDLFCVIEDGDYLVYSKKEVWGKSYNLKNAWGVNNKGVGFFQDSDEVIIDQETIWKASSILPGHVGY